MSLWNPKLKWHRANKNSDMWEEYEWTELMQMDRFWPGFIKGFISQSWRVEQFKEYVEEDTPGAPVDKWLADPLNYPHRNIIEDHILEGRYEGDGWFEGSDEPFTMTLRNTPGFFNLSSQIHDNTIYYDITEIITNLTPDSDPLTNLNAVRELGSHVGVPVNSLINRG